MRQKDETPMENDIDNAVYDNNETEIYTAERKIMKPLITEIYYGLMHGTWARHYTYMHCSMCDNITVEKFHKRHKLDESTARRQLKSPRSLSGRSIQLTLVTKWSWSWSWMIYCHPLCAMSIGPPILFQNLTMKIHGQGHVCGQRSRSILTLKNRRSKLWSRSNPLVTFEA